MKSVLGFLFLLSVSLSTDIYAQTYRVQFVNKCGGEYALSSEAIAKRNLRNIPFDDRDLPVCKDYIQQVQQIKGVELLYPLRWDNSVCLRATSTSIEEIKQLSFVQRVYQTSVITLKRSADTEKLEKVTNTQPATQVNENLYGASYTQNQMLGIPYLHQLGYTGKNVDIAIFDSGFEGMDEIEAFQSLFENGQVKGTFNIAGNNNEVFAHHNHGFYVASVIGGYLPNKLIGGAYDANFWLFRTEVVGSETKVEEEHWMRAAEIADSLGVDIINSSLGYTEFDDSTANYTLSDLDGRTGIVTQAANMAFEKGILVVTSAGNYRQRAWGSLGKPADALGSLSVGAVGENEQIADFSSPGPTADGRIKPELCAMGFQTVVASYNGDIIQASGTSFSAPMMTGAAACLWHFYPAYSNKQIKELLISAGSNFSNPDFDCGYGIPRVDSIVKQQLQPLVKKDLCLFALSDNKLLIKHLQNETIQKVEIFDSSGRVIYFSEPNSPQHAIQTLNIQAGFMLVKVIDDNNEQAVEKLVFR